MDKFTKSVLNYLAGSVVLIFLLIYIYKQVSQQLSQAGVQSLNHHGPWLWLAGAFLLFFLNTSLEGLKWHMLVKLVSPTRYFNAFASYLCGITFSVITPNRIGEYPGRILMLDKQNAFRYANVSVLGILSQLSAVYLYGFAGLLYFNIQFPTPIMQVALIFCLLVSVVWIWIYWKFESWLALLERYRWLRRYINYGKLLKQIPGKVQLTVFCISLVRFSLFTAQYLFLLRWMYVDVPIAGGFLTAALFFWTMAVTPSISLTEFGIRGSAGLYLFSHFSGNTIGILAATMLLWIVNLMVPAIFGSILIFRMKWIK